MASAEVVAVVRHRIDELQQGMVLRQLEGSSHDFLWGWSPEKVPNQAIPCISRHVEGLKGLFSWHVHCISVHVTR